MLVLAGKDPGERNISWNHKNAASTALSMTGEYSAGKIANLTLPKNIPVRKSPDSNNGNDGKPTGVNGTIYSAARDKDGNIHVTVLNTNAMNSQNLSSTPKRNPGGN